MTCLHPKMYLLFSGGRVAARYGDFLLLYFLCYRGLVFYFREMIFVQLFCDNFFTTLYLILTLCFYHFSSSFSLHCFLSIKREENEVVTKVVSNDIQISLLFFSLAMMLVFLGS